MRPESSGQILRCIAWSGCQCSCNCLRRRRSSMPARSANSALNSSRTVSTSSSTASSGGPSTRGTAGGALLMAVPLPCEPRASCSAAIPGDTGEAGAGRATRRRRGPAPTWDRACSSCSSVELNTRPHFPHCAAEQPRRPGCFRCALNASASAKRPLQPGHASTRQQDSSCAVCSCEFAQIRPQPKHAAAEHEGLPFDDRATCARSSSRLRKVAAQPGQQLTAAHRCSC